ncbi:hypothetical protein [Nodosilinea sp. E11]|uniref:hypothetical protein n=1 Tax=Nodosilinea sp. E11 TaxID=3037479 RepID=UPI0029343D9A|nr:hypothetical protein [Nodosilinea sp. E11]WOD37340.1 hypothetical protein RRF56_02280 [Nodosilinea sp. E11]
MPSNLLESILDATTEAVSQMAIDYGQLISLPELTEAQEDRLQEILDHACNDGALSFWISEIDHVIGHQMGLLNPDCRKDYENKKALLKEYFTELMESSSSGKSPEEIRSFLMRYSKSRSNPDFPDLLSSQERPNKFDHSDQPRSSRSVY